MTSKNEMCAHNQHIIPLQVMETVLHRALGEYCYRLKNSCGADKKSWDDDLIKEACICWVEIGYGDVHRGVFNPVDTPAWAAWRWPKWEGEWGYFLEIFPKAMMEKECSKYRKQEKTK
jgi:hypothetical protein